MLDVSNGNDGGFRHDLHHHRRDGGIFGAYTFHGLAAHQRRHLLCSVSEAFMFFFILRSSPARLCCINVFFSYFYLFRVPLEGEHSWKEALGCFPLVRIQIEYCVRRRQARDRWRVNDIPDWEGTCVDWEGTRGGGVQLCMRDKPTETEKKKGISRELHGL